MRCESGFALALLVVQPLVFFRRVLINPDRHIPYDLLGFHTPLADFIAYALRQGEWPWWDPFPYCGYPLHADIQAQLFYPPAWLAIAARNWGAAGTMFYWLEWLVAGHVALAGVLAFWLSRRLGCGVGAALLAGTAFQLGAFFSSQAQHLGAVCAAAWMPLAWLAVWELRGRWRLRWFSILSMAFAMSFLAGFAPMTLVVWASTFLVSLSLAGRRSWIAAAAGCAAVPLVMAQILPTLRLMPLTAASLRADWNQGAGTPMRAWWSLLVPNYHGVFTPFDETKFTGDYSFLFLYCYCGMATVVLAAAALWWGERLGRWFTLLALAFFVLQSGSFLPGFGLAFAWLPRAVRGTVYMNFFLGAASLALALAAAQMLRRASPRWAWLLSLATACDLTLTSSDRPMNSDVRSWRHVTSETQVDDSPATARQVERAMLTEKPPWRLDVLDLNYSFTMNASWRRLPTPNGDNPFAPLRLLELRRLFAPGNWWERQYPVVRPESPLLDFLNVGYLLAYSVREDRAALARAGWSEAGRTENGMRMYRNAEVMSRFFLARTVHEARDGAEALRKTQQVDLRNEVVVEEAAGVAAGGTGPVRVLRYALNEVDLETESDGAGVLVSSESFHPDWQATVDGAAARVLRVNSAFRGVAVGAGKHRVLMRYSPAGMSWMLAVMLGSWAIGLGAVIKSD